MICTKNVKEDYYSHSPSEPFLTLIKEPKTGPGGHPSLIRLVIDQVDQFFFNPHVLPVLNFANGADIKMRSERRESCCLVLKAYLYYCDLATLRVGFPSKGGSFVNIDYQHIAKMTNLGIRRVERAVRDLVSSGIMTHKRICVQSEGQTRGRACVKRLSRWLFDCLGYGGMADREIKKAKQRSLLRQVNPPSPGRAKAGRMRSLMDKTLKNMGNQKPHVSQQKAHQTHPPRELSPIHDILQKLGLT